MSRRRKIQAIEITTVDELRAALRVRKAELGLSMTKIDALAGFQFGYAGKIFSREGTKAHRNLTDFNLPRLLSALEARLVLLPVDEDGDAEKALRSAATHHSEAPEITLEKAHDAEKKANQAFADRGEAGRRKRWGRMSRKRRSQTMRDLAAQRWSATRQEREKARRTARAKKAAKARWAKAKKGTKRLIAASQAAQDLPQSLRQISD
ncbi:MAG: hypothetical protein ACRCTG_14575 [Aestuariivirga sp.]